MKIFLFLNKIKITKVEIVLYSASILISFFFLFKSEYTEYSARHGNRTTSTDTSVFTYYIKMSKLERSKIKEKEDFVRSMLSQFGASTEAMTLSQKMEKNLMLSIFLLVLPLIIIIFKKLLSNPVSTLCEEELNSIVKKDEGVSKQDKL
jgi:hypothetical protein